MAFDFGEFWTKGQRMGTGQTSVKQYNRHLCKLIELGKAKPSFIVSHELSLEEAPEAYGHFDARENGWTKILLKPQLAATKRAPKTEQSGKRQHGRGEDVRAGGHSRGLIHR